VLLDAVGIAVEDHPVADVSGLSLPEIQALSFHDPTPFSVDPGTIPEAQKAVMAANGTALAVYAGSPAMADPTLLGRLSGIKIPTLVLWGESDRIVEPAYGRAYAAGIAGARFESSRPPGACPRWRAPVLSWKRSLRPGRGDDELPGTQWSLNCETATTVCRRVGSD
jgi:pimeloyl-ACP methyl ester carboxylesterase